MKRLIVLSCLALVLYAVFGPVYCEESPVADAGAPVELKTVPLKQPDMILSKQDIIRPDKMRIVGAAGEEYVSFTHASPPKVYVNGKPAGVMGFG